MRRIRQRIAPLVLALFVSALAAPWPAAAQSTSPVDLSVPPPAPVTLPASTSAFIVVDLLQSTCPPNPLCMNTLPAEAAGLQAARAANVHVLYTVHLAPDNVILTDVAPATSDPIVAAIPGDKFFDSNLDYILRQAGITNLVLTGVNSNSGIMYTAGAAAQRGYTVVVAQDVIAGADAQATTVARWQLLHGPGANPQNTPLLAKAITLSQTDLITYQ